MPPGGENRKFREAEGKGIQSGGGTSQMVKRDRGLAQDIIHNRVRTQLGKGNQP